MLVSGEKMYIETFEMKLNSFVRITINWPIFYKRTHNAMDKKGLPKFVQKYDAYFSIKKDLKSVIFL